ncbi:MAG: SIR2 family protein [Actinomycetota bacterium]|nr:SIR2 family protein [Actinomycetota bacterium]
MLRARGEDLQILEYYRLKRHDNLAPLRNDLLKDLNAPDDALTSSVIHEALVALRLCDIYYTTNYDDFLERAMKLAGRRCQAVATEVDVGRFLSDAHSNVNAEPAVRVVKFHGDLNNPDEMVLSDRHYRDRLRLTTPMDALLRADLLGRAVLFLGYSFRDWNVSYLFHLIEHDFGPELPDAPLPNRAFITVADPSDFEYQLFGARKIGVIPVSGTAIAEDTAALLDAVRNGGS